MWPPPAQTDEGIWGLASSANYPSLRVLLAADTVIPSGRWLRDNRTLMQKGRCHMTMADMGPGPVLIDAVARDWWLILVRGLAAIALGLVCFIWPAISLLALVLVWGVYTLVDGVGAIAWGVRSRWWWMGMVGAVSVLAGLTALAWPGITALALLYVIAVWAVVRGVSEIVAAVRLRRWIENEWLLALAGAASVAFGVLVMLSPGAGALSVLWLLGSFAIVFGGIAVVLSLRLRSWQRTRKLQREEPLVGAAGGARKQDEDMR
jgi:uncharacterized membrane protein HdeD (DUF308 family)